MRRPGLRSALVPLSLIAVVAAGCATSSGPGPTSSIGAAAGTAQADTPPAPKVPVDSRDAQARAQLELGRAAMARGDMAAATIPLREALRLQPEMVEARESLGLALYDMGDVDAAIEELRAARRQRPDASLAQRTLAAALIARRDWSAARAELEDLLRTQPDLIQAHYSLGLARYALGDLNGAIDSYREVLARSPNHADARYNLALTLKLAHRDAEATPEFLAAARAGHAVAQYFVGAAYASGTGVGRDLTQAVLWWSRADDQDVAQAGAALAELRQIALGRSRRPSADRPAVEQAFRDYRAALWDEFSDLARDPGDETIGAALLRRGRGREAVGVLIREASALSEPAQGLLESLYTHGIAGQVPAHDTKILEYFKAAAAEGQVRPRISLARFYAGGLGVPQDTARAVSLLKATPHEDAQRLLQELLASSPAPVRP